MNLKRKLKSNYLQDGNYNSKLQFHFSLNKFKTQSRQSKNIAIIEKIMMIVGIIGQTLFYFQAYKIYTTASAKDVSVLGFSFALFSLACWLLYGLIIKNKVLIIVNTFAVIGATLTLIAIFIVS